MDANGAKKRKRDGGSSKHPKKKVAIEAPASTATISSVLQPKSSPPVIAVTHGVKIPANTHFKSYSSQPEPNARSKSSKRSKNMLLHSTAHPYVDYTAKEDNQKGLGPSVNHFLGVYDPQSGKLQLIEAKRMVVRGAVRAKQDNEAVATESGVKQTMMELKADLGQTFGTKKAKKALQDNILNAISPQKKNGERPATQLDDAARAMLSSVGDITSTMASREELQAVVDKAKPGPKANLEAEDIADVYDPKVIIGGDILNLVPIREWQEKARHKENIQASSRYVVARVTPIALNEEATTRLRVLRYYYFVLLFFLHTKPGKQRGTRQIPPREKLREALSPAPEAVVENIRRKFSDGGEMRQFHIQMLITHCCAFAAIVDNFEVDTQNLRDDLRLDQKGINQYFHEIGARVKPVTNKADNRTVHVAKLTLPLEFPRQRHIAQRRK